MKRVDPRTLPSPRFAACAALVAAAVAAAGCGSSDDASSPTKAGAQATAVAQPTQATSVLGVLSAGGGSFEDGTLTLADVNPRGVWFTDRPGRDAGTDGIDGFLKLFFSREDPPNAAVHVSGADASEDLAVVELSEPDYDASAAELTFRAQLLPDESERDAATRATAHAGIAGSLARDDGALPATFDDVSVFVDAAAADALTPDEQLAQQYADENATLLAGYERLAQQTRVVINKGVQDRACWLQFLDDQLEVTQNLLGEVKPDIQKLQADIAKNGGTIPASDKQLQSTVAELMGNASETLQEFERAFARRKASGYCPFS